MLDLGARLLSAGLLSRGQLAEALRVAKGGALVPPLVDGGLPEESLAGFFLAEGLGPLLGEPELADPGAAKRIPREMAQKLLALPVREEGGAVVVAMADPTDADAIAEVARATGARVVPAVARLSVLRRAIEKAWSAPAEEPAVELVTRRASRPNKASVLDLPIDVGEPTYASGGGEGGAKLAGDDAAVPLVRPKPMGPPRERSKTQDMLRVEEPPKTHAVATIGHAGPASPQQGSHPLGGTPASTPPPKRDTDPAPAPDQPAVVQLSAVKPVAPLREVRQRSPSHPSLPEPGTLASQILEADKWATLPPVPNAQPESKLVPGGAKALPKKPGAPTSPGDPGPVLAALRATSDRDEAVRLACEGAQPACRCIVFLALKKDVLQGREVRGGGVSREAVRNLWIPITSASVFREAVSRGIAYAGPYGTTAADGIYRAAISSRGGEVVVQPIMVSGKAVGVLCADDPKFGPRGEKRVELVARALGETLERLILSGKKT